MIDFLHFTDYLYKAGKIPNTFSKINVGSKESPTHIIIPFSEYAELSKSYTDMKDALEETKRALINANQSSEEFKESTIEKLKQYDELMEEKCTIEETNKSIMAENEILKKQVLNFKRVAKERSNVEKGLIPKKKRKGYSIRRMVPIDYTYRESGSSKTERIPMYLILFISPYEVIMDRNVVEQLVIDDFFTGDELRNPIIVDENNKEYIFNTYDELIRLRDPNLLKMFFNIKLVINTQNKYWEVMVNRIEPFNEIPANYLPTRKESN